MVSGLKIDWELISCAQKDLICQNFEQFLSTWREENKQNQNKTGRISLGLSTFHVSPIANGKVLLASSRTLLLYNVFHVNFPSFRKVAWSFHRHLYVGCPGCPVRWRAVSSFRRPQRRAQPAHRSSRAGCVREHSTNPSSPALGFLSQGAVLCFH